MWNQWRALLPGDRAEGGVGVIRMAINKREQADNQRDRMRHRACAPCLSSKDLRARIREQARSTAGTRVRAGAHAGWRIPDQRAGSRLLRCARSGPSAQTGAGDQLGPAANGSSLAEKRPEATRERTPLATEFVLSVRTTAPGRDVARLGPTWATRAGRVVRGRVLRPVSATAAFVANPGDRADAELNVGGRTDAPPR